MRKITSAGTNSAILGIRISAPPDSVPSANARAGTLDTEAVTPSAILTRVTFFMTPPRDLKSGVLFGTPDYLTTNATTKPIRARASAKAAPMMKTVKTRS